MKTYRHKKLGWIIKEQDNGYDATQPNTLITTIPKELIEESNDRELEDKDILVPDCIKISPSYGDYSMGIIKGNQELFYDYDCKVYGININHKRLNKIKCKLVKVNPKDREIGKIYYASYDGLKDIDDILYYHLYLGEGHYIYFGYRKGFLESLISNIDYYDRYEVVPFN